MKKIILLISFIFGAYLCKAQNNIYKTFIKSADSLYKAKEYKKAALNYSEAFKSLGWKGQSDDRYNAACSWAQANVPDSSFFQLNRIVSKANYMDYEQISSDKDLTPLHTDARWKPLLKIIKEKKEKAEASLNKPLAAKLDSIYIEDQKYRKELNPISKKFGWDSKEVQAHWAIINEKDSLNLIIVTSILDKYGWLGEDVVGSQGNNTLFLVIQHSNQSIQEKYLPMMQEAVKKGNASGSSLALLEDRVALGQGKRQIYGSQIGRDPETENQIVLPLEDPDNVDIRRAQVGLPPLASYIEYWQMKWDAEQYKKDLPALEARLKVGRK
jgi:hypothetical protein